MLKYKCLVLDHDDTVVDSTATIHHPAFRQALQTLHPGTDISLDDYFRYNFSPGFTALCHEILHFTPEEMAYQTENWQNWVKAHVPKAYDGFRALLHNFAKEGGTICVVSHSMSVNIARDYKENDLPAPEIIIGWDVQPEKRKPAPWPLQEIMRKLNLKPEELLMVDDLKPGKTMAESCNVPFAAAGWAHQIPELIEDMCKGRTPYCRTVQALNDLVFGTAKE